MTDKTLYTLKLGGNDVTLKFRMGALKRLKGLLDGKDPYRTIVELAESKDLMEMVSFTEKAIISASLANGNEYTQEQLAEWLDEIDIQSIIDTFSAACAAYTPSAAQEGGDHTQQ